MMNSAHPTNILHGQDLLSGAENLLIENFAKTCGAVPAAEALSRFLAEAFGLDLATDPDIVVGFGRVDDDLPTAPRALLRRIILHRDVAAARDAGAVSPATFYRELHDLRCWLRALGVRPEPAASARAATPMPSRP